MSNKIVQLENEDGDNIYPLAGGALTGSISKTMLEEGVFEGPELSQPSSVAYVATDNIQDGAVTSDKIDSTTLSTLLFSGDAMGTEINLSESVDNFSYIIFLVRSALNDTAPLLLKFPTRSALGITTDAARYRYSLAVPFMISNGGIGTDCVQYIASGDGKKLSVKYQGYNYIASNGNTNTSNTASVHVVKIYGTNVL